jgi:very-short-patch-repair endonuclease
MSASVSVMTEISSVLAAFGEVATIATLRAAGIADRRLRDAVRDGIVRRLRPGWYASWRADSEQCRAVTLHGRLGCASALERLGVWSGTEARMHVHVPRNAARLNREPVELHVHVPRNAARLNHEPIEAAGGTPVWHPRTPQRMRRSIRVADPHLVPAVHWREEVDPAAALDWIVSPTTALAEATRCLPPEHAQAAIDSVIAERVLRRRDVERIVAAAPARSGLVVDELCDRLESGVESLFVRRLIAAGYRVDPQFRFGQFGRFDGVIEGCVLFEVDGWLHHSTRASFVSDRERTLVGQAFGMPVVRAAATQVLADWPLVEAAVARTVADAMRLRRVDGRPSAF